MCQREKEIHLEQDKEANMEATLQALEEITEVPREEMERIAEEIKASYEEPKKEINRAVIIGKNKQIPTKIINLLSNWRVVISYSYFFSPDNDSICSNILLN